MSTAYEQQLLRAFGKRVALIRKKKGITQQQLAEQVGVSVVAIAYIETGKRWARIGTLGRIAKSLGVGIQKFFEDM